MRIKLHVLLCAIGTWMMSTLTLAQAFEVRVEVAAPNGVRVADNAWVQERLNRATEIFAPADVSFRTASIEGAEDLPAHIETRVDRHALGPRVLPSRGSIHVFVVEGLADVDIAGRALRGVHWRSRRGGGPRHFVILSTLAGPTVLAHELGHFFGNPHSDTPGNIMSYTRADVPPFFDRPQLRRIRRFAARFVESGELRISG